MDVGEATQTIQPVMIRSLTLLFPYVQSLPEDREIVVQTDRGVCFLVVWAHHLLGFTVLVKERLTSPGGFAETVFKGELTSTLIIDPNARTSFDSSVTLLERSTNESLISIAPQADEDEGIDCVVKRPVAGYGMWLLNISWTQFVGFHGDKARHAFLTEIMLMSLALALRLSRHFYMADRANSRATTVMQHYGPTTGHIGEDELDHWSGNGHNIADIPKQKVLEAAQLLFDAKKLSNKDLAPYVLDQMGVPSSEIKMDHRVAAACEQYGYDSHAWPKIFRSIIIDLAVVTLVLAQTTNLENAAGCFFRGGVDEIRSHHVSMQARCWDGRELICIVEDVWFSLAVELLTGRLAERIPHSAKDLTLVSDGGWTLYLPTFGNLDPASIGRPTLIVSRLPRT